MPVNPSLFPKALGVALGLALLAPPVSAGSAWRAWSDQATLPPVQDQRAQLLEGRETTCMATARDLGTPGLAVGGGRNIEEMIKSLEEVLAGMKPTDQGYAALEQSLGMLREQRGRGGAGPGAPLGSMTLAQALANADRLVGSVPQTPPPNGAEVVEAALANSRPKAALAALLAAHRKAPKNPWILVNTAGMLGLVGMPREAIALLDAADALGGTLPAPGGVPGKALALNNRGYALLGLGRWQEAQAPLRAALRLAPDLAEANLNLSQALLCGGDADGAVRALRAGMRRTPNGSAGTGDIALAETTPNRHGAGLKPLDDAPVRRPSRALFDLSHGSTWTMPNLRLPSTPEEAEALGEQYRALEKRGEADDAATWARISALEARRRAAGHTPEEDRWANLVKAAIDNAHFDPDLWPDYKAAWDAHYAYYEAFKRLAGERRDRLTREVEPLTTCEAQRDKEREIDVWYLDSLRSFAKGQEEAMGRYASKLVRVQTALAANVGDADTEALFRAHIEMGARALFYGPVVGDALYMTIPSPSKYNCGGHAEAAPLNVPPLPDLTGSTCDLPSGTKVKAKLLKVEGFGLDLGLSCRKLDLEFSPSVSGWVGIGLFAGASLDFKGSATLFVGIKASLKPPKGSPGSSVNKSGASAKESLYLRFGKGGLEDAGLRVQGSVSLGAGTDALAGVWEAKLDQDFGVAAATAYWSGK